MLKNYLIIALRHMLKNKLYASINILGLTVGLAVYLFGTLLVTYEKTHDNFFEHYERIYNVGTVFSETGAKNVGVGETDGIYSAFGPFFKSDVPELEAVARTITREYLITIGDDHFYEQVKFADPEFLQIFGMKYIEGDSSALEDPSGLMVTRTMAEKLFGNVDVIGQTITLDHDVSIRVTAVIENLPINTHFSSSLVDNKGFGLVAPLAALHRAAEYDLAGNFNNLSFGDGTYILAPADKDLSWVQTKVDGVFTAHYPEPEQDFIKRLRVRPIVEANTVLFDAIGMPVLESIQLLALLVLVVAIVNYTNLATAQSLNRAREVGLRKTMGAGRRQLLVQFLIESLCIVAVSMLLALALLELMIPLFNDLLDRGVTINYLETLPWIFVTTLIVGVVAGAYPAYLITRAAPIDALHESSKPGGGIFRGLMLGLQFSISIFMLAMVMIMLFQNDKVRESANIYPHKELLTLQRMGLESIQDRMDTLRNELQNIPGVSSVSYISQRPYVQSSSAFGVGPTLGDEDDAFLLMNINVDDQFLDTFDIPLLAGRNLSRDISADQLKEGALALNVLVNEMAIDKLGLTNPQDALGKVFYDFADERESRAYTIVGVLPDQNYQGFHNQIKPMAFFTAPTSLNQAAIRVKDRPMNQVLTDVENVWNELIPDYPMQSEYMDDTFEDTFQVFGAMTTALAGFAVVALTLSLIGLFGLAAFMAQVRTREIGIRKVMGASIPQIVRLLVWQFSKPVMWALAISLPLAYLASETYLSFFANRVELHAIIVIIAGVIAVLFSWLIVSLHAFRIARANPIGALRYE